MTGTQKAVHGKGRIGKQGPQRRFYAADYIYGAEKAPVVCRMLKSDVPTDVRTRFVVNPMDAYYVRGNPIRTEFPEK